MILCDQQYKNSTYTLNKISPDSMFILMQNWSILLSCLCLASYPSNKAFLYVSPAPAYSARFKSTRPNLIKERPPLHSLRTDILKTHRSRTPVEAFANILQGKENLAPHRTLWSRTSSLKNKRLHLYRLHSVKLKAVLFSVQRKTFSHPRVNPKTIEN